MSDKILLIPTSGLDGRFVNKSNLASVASGLGASLVGVQDAGGYYTGTTVEAVLQEIGSGTALNGQYVRRSNNLSDLSSVTTARTNLGLVAGGAGDIWVEKAGDTMTGGLIINGSGSTSATNALKVANSSGDVSLNIRDNQTVSVGALSDPLGWARFYVAGGGFRSDDDFRFQKGSGIQYISRLNAAGSGGQSGYDLEFQVYGDTLVMYGAGGLVINESGESVNDFRVEGDTDANLIFSKASNDSLGIGHNSPTAKLHVTAGTATAGTAPFKLTSGTKLTTPEAGVHEYNGNHLLTNSALRFPIGGTLFDHFVDVGNTHTDGVTFDDIYSDTTIANTLLGNGDKITAMYSGIFVSSATATREVKVLFAGTTILDTGALTTAVAESWEIRVTLIRVSATVVRCQATMISSTVLGASPFIDTTYTEVTGLTLSGTNILKVSAVAGGVGAAANDIVGKLGCIEFKPAS